MSILVVDDDAGTLQTWTLLLREAGFTVVPVNSGLDALAITRKTNFELVISDDRLGDIRGTDLLRDIRARGIYTPFIIVTGFASPRSAVEAIKLGASEYVEKPLIGDDLINLVTNGMSECANQHNISSNDHNSYRTARVEPHAATRWSAAVADAIQLTTDPRTLSAWGRGIGASASSIRAWCYAAGISPRRSLDLARLIRATTIAHLRGWQPHDALDVIDQRTLQRLFERAGFSEHQLMNDWCGQDAFVARQSLVRSPLAIRRLRDVLMERGKRRVPRTLSAS